MESKMHRITPKTAVIIVLSLLTLAVIALVVTVIILTGQIRELEKKSETLAVYAAAVPEYTYPESTDVVTIDDAYLGEISIPALENVPRASYDYEKLALKNGRYEYAPDGITTSTIGIDVSYHNGTIDWAAVAADGIDFAMIRLGYRGYEEGIIKPDPKFEENIAGAVAAGLDVGVYFYSQAIDTDEALEEAEYVIDMLAPYPITYPVALDIEITEAEDVRANELSGAVLTEVTTVFCERIREEGLRPMVYANKRMAYLKLDMRKICKYDFWYAEYTADTPPTFDYDFRIWQYATDGRVAGIDNDVDMNICFTHYSA
jgi:GH25 family lysozyme M1 (1,4-beta-N-acetylmuramidase)